jgi:GNAT superfamily N-acetyltransferase
MTGADEVRADQAAGEIRVLGAPGEPMGFHLLKGDELNQLYVAAEARGLGVAARLIADAESRLAVRGVDTGWLACAVGNARAARFYAKSGWRRTRVDIYRSETANGQFDVDIWRYEKALRPIP